MKSFPNHALALALTLSGLTLACSDPNPDPAPTTYIIQASSGTHGTMSPAGPRTVREGASQAFTLQAAEGYEVASLLVDGAEQDRSRRGPRPAAPKPSPLPSWRPSSRP